MSDSSLYHLERKQALLDYESMRRGLDAYERISGAPADDTLIQLVAAATQDQRNRVLKRCDRAEDFTSIRRSRRCRLPALWEHRFAQRCSASTVCEGTKLCLSRVGESETGRRPGRAAGQTGLLGRRPDRHQSFQLPVIATTLSIEPISILCDTGSNHDQLARHVKIDSGPINR